MAPSSIVFGFIIIRFGDMGSNEQTGYFHVCSKTDKLPDALFLMGTKYRIKILPCQ